MPVRACCQKYRAMGNAFLAGKERAPDRALSSGAPGAACRATNDDLARVVETSNMGRQPHRDSHTLLLHRGRNQVQLAADAANVLLYRRYRGTNWRLRHLYAGPHHPVACVRSARGAALNVKSDVNAAPGFWSRWNCALPPLWRRRYRAICAGDRGRKNQPPIRLCRPQHLCCRRSGVARGNSALQKKSPTPPHWRAGRCLYFIRQCRRYLIRFCIWTRAVFVGGADHPAVPSLLRPKRGCKWPTSTTWCATRPTAASLTM